MVDIATKTISGEHYSAIADVVEDGWTLRDCYIVFDTDTPIFEGIKGLTFEGQCHLHNCILPEDAIVGPDCFELHEDIDREIIEPDPQEQLQRGLNNLIDMCYPGDIDVQEALKTQLSDSVTTAVSALPIRINPIKEKP